MHLAPYPIQTKTQLRQPFTILAQVAHRVPPQSVLEVATTLEGVDGLAQLNHHEPRENHHHNHHHHHHQHLKTRGLEAYEGDN